MAIETITVPDFGDVQDITVLEVYVSVGDRVEKEDSLVSLESEKAVMDIPSPLSGVIKEIRLGEGDKVQSGDVIALAEVEGTGDKETGEEAEKAGKEVEKQGERAEAVAPREEAAPAEEARREPAAAAEEPEAESPAHATPSVRAYAREQGVDLARVAGSGPKGRILKEDVQQFAAKGRKTGEPAAPAAAAGLPMTEQPLEDFSRYGPVEEVALGRIKKLSGPHLHRNWLTIPHVTHFDEADITELEAFRKQMNRETDEEEIKFSPLVFIVKAVIATLRAFPLFNSSLIPGSDRAILKKYYNIGIAVDTPNGLVVPVIKNADRKGIREIAFELQKLSGDAREGKLTISDLQGGCFTISSLGSIGGTGFTPIINGPEVAILGLSRNYQKPVWDGETFIPRLTLPFSLSYDHRVIDGAEAARFCRSLSSSIADLRRALL